MIGPSRPAAADRPRAIVVGATFGAVYAEALVATDSPVELVGLLSTGSATSAKLAARLGITLYTNLEDLPRVDVAFVVVRSGVVGGEGTRIAEQLLMRGVHVLQEQPVHPEEILTLLRVAKAHSRQYAVNDFYSRVAPVRQFIDAARALDTLAAIRYVHARSSIHVSYPLFTILAAFVGSLTPARITVPRPPGQPGAQGRPSSPFIYGRMTLGDVAVDLLIQNELCATDPDNHARLLHSIVVGSDAGELVLAHTHGSTRWHPRPRTDVLEAPGAPGAPGAPEALDVLAADVPVSATVGLGFEPTAAQVRNELWPQAIRLAAGDFVESIGRGGTAVTQRFVRATRLWAEFTAELGPARPIEPSTSAPVWAAQLSVR